MTRIALLSDIHGNHIALEAVLEDVNRHGGVDGFGILGDLVAIGPDPIAVLNLIKAMPNTIITRGNTDRYVTSGARPKPDHDDVIADPSLLPKLIEIAESFSWTKGMVTSGGRLEWLAGLPLEYRINLPDGTRFLGVHASPGQDNDPVIHPYLSPEELQNILKGCNADLVCVGHSHMSMDLKLDGIHLVNLGSVSNPFPPDLGASYAILEADASGYTLEHHTADYDHEAVIAAVKHSQHPASDLIIRHMRGERLPPWKEN